MSRCCRHDITEVTESKMTCHDLFKMYTVISWPVITCLDLSWSVMTCHDLFKSCHDLFMSCHDLFKSRHDLLWPVKTYHDLPWPVMTCRDLSLKRITYLHSRIALLCQPLDILTGFDSDSHGLVDFLDCIIMLAFDLVIYKIKPIFKKTK